MSDDGNGYARTPGGPSEWPTVTHRALVIEDDAGHLLASVPLSAWGELDESEREWLRASRAAVRRRVRVAVALGAALLGLTVAMMVHRRRGSG
jgi:hypothetical protein